MLSATFRHRIIPLALVCTLASCDSGGTTDPPDTPTIGVSLVSATLSVIPGQSGTVGVNVSRGGGFTGAVNLTLEGAPTGVTGVFTPASVASGSTTSSLAVSAGATAVPGNYTLTVRAAGSGVTAVTSALQLTVQAHPAIAVTVNVTSLSVVQGGSNTAGIVIARTNFPGEVSLSVSGAPADVTASVAPAATTADASVLTVSAAATAIPGDYTLEVTAQGTGIATQTVEVPVIVVAAQQEGFSLALDPAAVSVQQGASATSRLTATRSGGFTGPLTLSATGAPAGVTVGFPSTTLAGDTMTLTVTVAGPGSAGGSPVPGAYILTVSGAATGLPTQTATLALTVTAGAGGYTLAMSPAAVSAAAGASSRSAVRIARTGGFAGAVSLAVTGGPTGLTPTLAEVTTLADSVELTLATTAALAPGTYPLTITGTVAGLADQTTTLTVTITPAVTGGFTIALNPTSLSLAQGADGTSAVNISRTGGFTGDVTLSVTGAPAGLTAALDATTVGGASTTLRLTAGAMLAPGSYTVTVRGNATGITEQTADLAVTITTSGGGNVTFTFCAGEEPIFFAAQDGNGAWARIDPVGGQFSFTITERGGVAYADGPGDMTVHYASAAEFTAQGGGACLGGDPPGGKTLTGSVAGLGVTDLGSITLGPVATSVFGMPGYTLNNVPDGPLDLVASRATFGGGGSVSVNKFIIRRGLNLPDASVIPILDFGAAEAFDPVLPTLTINGLGTDEAFLGLGYVTTNNAGFVGFGTSAFYHFESPRDAIGPYPGIPAAQQVAGDLHMVNIFANSAVGDDPPVRGYFSYFGAATDRTVTLADPLSAPTVSVLATSPYLRLRVQLPVQTAYDGMMTALLSQTDRVAAVSATAGYFTGGFTTWDVSIPDLTAIGFNSLWGLANAETTHSVSAYSGMFDVVPGDGFVLQYAARTASITP